MEYRNMYEAAFRSIDDTLWKDAGCSTELDYIEQTSWVLFLKYLDDYEASKEKAAEADGKAYQRRFFAGGGGVLLGRVGSTEAG